MAHDTVADERLEEGGDTEPVAVVANLGRLGDLEAHADALARSLDA